MLVKHVEACRNKRINDSYHGYKTKVSLFCTEGFLISEFWTPFWYKMDEQLSDQSPSLILAAYKGEKMISSPKL